MDPTIRHPAYHDFAASWRLMRDAVAGEDDVKAAGEKYLPMKSGQKAIADPAIRAASYNAYRLRAEFPEITAPTIRGAVGVMLAKPAKIELPTTMEGLRENATLDGLTLDALHRRVAMEVMTTGRYGLLPGLSEDGTPHLSGYVAESILNWDAKAGRPDFVVLDETAQARDPVTGAWGEVERLRECVIEDWAFVTRIWTKAGGGWVSEELPRAMTPRRVPLSALPFVFIGTNDLTPAPDDVPLYGLAKLAMRVYRLDADFTFSLHMTSEPTPWANGFNDAADAVEKGNAPRALGSSVLWLLPEGAQAGYLEFSGPGLEKQANAIADALDRAAQFGAQIMQAGNAAESGEALRLRAASQTATLTSIAQTTASGLERALRNIAVWIGADPMQVIVTPNLEFFDRTMSSQDITALVQAWHQGALSYPSLFARLKAGGVLQEDRTLEDEEAALEPPDF